MGAFTLLQVPCNQFKVKSINLNPDSINLDKLLLLQMITEMPAQYELLQIAKFITPTPCIFKKKKKL